MTGNGEQNLSSQLRGLIERPELLTAVHLKIEDQLIELRDSRTSFGLHANGLVCNERDGEPSPVIRIGTRMAIKEILMAFADELEKEDNV